VVKCKLKEQEAPKMKYAGKRIAKSHSTAIDAAKPFIKEALRRPEVTKVSLGPIKQKKRQGAVNIKMVDIDHGLKCTVTGNASVQVLYVYTKDRGATASALKRVAPKKRGKKKVKRANAGPNGSDDPFSRYRK
jgi:hypothetical protein